MFLICSVFSFYLVISFAWIHLLGVYIMLEVFVISFSASAYLHWNELLSTHLTTASFEFAKLIMQPTLNNINTLIIYALYSTSSKLMFNERERPKRNSLHIKICKIFLADFIQYLPTITQGSICTQIHDHFKKCGSLLRLLSQIIIFCRNQLEKC